MEKAKEFLMVNDQASESASRLAVPPHPAGIDHVLLEDIVLEGIRVDRAEPGLVVCSFKDRAGGFATGAISYLVDEVGGAAINVEGLPRNVSVDMSISFLSAAKPDDELEITGSLLGQRGGYYGTLVLIRNKATGEVVAEGRHSLFGKRPSKL
ncbi:uncharacterized protein LOC131314357 isoform X2 [Rhododendron vialii]|uniref:uncharacterized protein LOC131314357 isoform X2 n=1 Tax=Rhododendron vialii TaxID=182163 RepID=UPI00265FC531|nr:uncharacterized protein LOC131314357 isoform X2 [Rhododendron vialii]